MTLDALQYGADTLLMLLCADGLKILYVKVVGPAERGSSPQWFCPF